jgi:hypothetical protein
VRPSIPPLSIHNAKPVQIHFHLLTVLLVLPFKTKVKETVELLQEPSLLYFLPSPLRQQLLDFSYGDEESNNKNKKCKQEFLNLI